MTISETAHWLSARDQFLVLTHRRPDGDTLGCAAGLVEGLLEAGKTAYILYNPEATARYTTYVEKHWAPEGFVPAHIISVDIASQELLPPNAAAFRDNIDLCIDHHPSNTQYASSSCIDTTRAACGEIVYEILMALNGRISTETATSLYVALSTDTGCFAFANTTSNTLRVAATLVDAGAPIGEINRELFRRKAKSRMMLEGLITAGMAFYFNGAVAVATVTREMLAQTGASDNELDDIASIPGSIEEVIVGITIREMTDEEGCKVSVRTTPLVNANDLCARFGGGGHAMAAGFSIKASSEKTTTLLVDALGDVFSESHTGK
ncbi:DHH family phosphoesterase [Oscillospiraceae bacterium WX1]